MDLAPDPDALALVADLDRRFAGIAARAAAADAAGELPAQNWTDVADSGYLRLFHATADGGAGAPGVTQAAAMEALARACPATFWSATMSTLVCGKLIATYVTGPRRRALLDALTGGARQACFAVVERTSGSDASTYTTTVRRRGEQYVIDGEKARITNAPTADLAVVLARLEGGPEDWCFAVVDLRRPGVGRFTLPPTGLRAMPWGGLSFAGVPVAATDVAPVPFGAFAEGMAWGWLFISIAAIATAQAALDASLAHATTQAAFGRTLADLQGVRAMLADMHVEIEAARLLAWRAAWHRAEGRSARELIAMLKAHATEMAVRVVEQAVQIHGSWGLTRGRPVERMWRDAPMNVIGGFASNRLRELVAADLGLPTEPYPDPDALIPRTLLEEPP